MKYIKKYNEDIDWVFDDEEIPLYETKEFEKGDKVILIEELYEKTKVKNGDAKYYKSPKNYEIINNINKIKIHNYMDHYMIIEKINIRYDGKQIFKLYGKWPWFVSDYWKKWI